MIVRAKEKRKFTGIDIKNDGQLLISAPMCLKVDVYDKVRDAEIIEPARVAIVLHELQKEQLNGLLQIDGRGNQLATVKVRNLVFYNARLFLTDGTGHTSVLPRNLMLNLPVNHDQFRTITRQLKKCTVQIPS